MSCPDGMRRSAFTALATEIKLGVFANVRSNADQGNVCLVSKEWHRLMKPQMWRGFTTSLTSNFISNLHASSKEHKDCFQLIRALTVQRSHLKADYGSHLSDLLHRLRRDQLLEFNSDTDSPLHVRQLLGLLRHQTNLNCLRVRLDWAVGAAAIESVASWAIESTSLLAAALRGLKTLRVYVADSNMPGEHTQALHDYEIAYNNIFLAAVPRLDRLEIVGWRWNGMPRNQRVQPAGLIEYAVGVNQLPGMLQHLIFVNLDFAKAGDGLMRALNLDTLCVLRLDYCDRLGVFLRALAATLRQRTTTRLKALTIRTNPFFKAGENDCLIGLLEDLLPSFNALVELECSFFWAAWVDWKHSLHRHRGLEKLHVSSAIMRDVTSSHADTITDMLSQCPKLQYFAYQPIAPYFGYIIDCEFPTELNTRLCQSLDVVAKAPELRVLRLLYAPGITEDKLNRQNDACVAKAARLAHCLATLILSHLYMRGSNVRILALSAESRWKHSHADSNYHFYPHYFYKAKVTDCKGQKVVNALPLWDYVAECPEFEVFT